MRTAALLVSLIAILAGVVGLVAPESLLALGRYVTTPLGLAVIGSVRVVIGLVLMGVAPTSRAPRTVRVCGALIAAAGLATPLLGVERTRAVLDWEAAQGPGFIRAVAGLLVVIGGFIAAAVGSQPRLTLEP